MMLGHSYDDFSGSLLSGEVRRDTKRKIRRLSEIGKVRLVCAADKQTSESILLEMIRQKRLRYRNTDQRDFLADENVRRFYRECPERLGLRGYVHCSALYVGNELVAAHWGVVSDGRFYWLMPSFEADPWGKYSPGRVLLFFLFDWAANQHLYEFDLTIGDEYYKKKWSNAVMPLFEHLTPLTFLGKFYVWYRKLNLQYWLEWLRLMSRKTK